MNYTEKYHLPQWEENDRIMRTDFNQMCADLEEGIAQAQETAEELPYVVGIYQGGNGLNIALGFRPSAVLIGPDFKAPSDNAISSLSGMPALFTPTTTTAKVGFTDDGFVVYACDGKTFPIVNGAGMRYSFIAFK